VNQIAININSLFILQGISFVKIRNYLEYGFEIVEKVLRWAYYCLPALLIQKG
jgi:hypothetical protein